MNRDDHQRHQNEQGRLHDVRQLRKERFSTITEAILTTPRQCS